MSRPEKLNSDLLRKIISEEKEKLGIVDEEKFLKEAEESIASLEESELLYLKKLKFIRERKKQLQESVKKYLIKD